MIIQTENMSPRINTHDSIEQNSIAIIGATKTANMSLQFKDLKKSRFNQSNQSIEIIFRSE